MRRISAPYAYLMRSFLHMGDIVDLIYVFSGVTTSRDGGGATGFSIASTRK